MARFKLSEQAALEALLSLRYTLNDIQNDHSLTAYVQAMVRNGKECRPPHIKSTVVAWTKLDAELQRDVPGPRAETQRWLALSNS